MVPERQDLRVTRSSAPARARDEAGAAMKRTPSYSQTPGSHPGGSAGAPAVTSRYRTAPWPERSAARANTVFSDALSASCKALSVP